MPEHLTPDQARVVAACISQSDDVHEFTRILLALMAWFPTTDWLHLLTLGPRESQNYRDFAYATYQPSESWSLGPEDPWAELRTTLRTAELVDRRERQRRRSETEAGAS